jgi:hypothetical protein
MIKTGRAYVIDWLDHCDGDDQGHAWFDLVDVEAKAVQLRTVGYLIKVARDAIAVAHTMDLTQSSLPFTIVRSAIVSMQELTLPEPLAKVRRKPRTRKPRTEAHREEPKTLP